MSRARISQGKVRLASLPQLLPESPKHFMGGLVVSGSTSQDGWHNVNPPDIRFYERVQQLQRHLRRRPSALQFFDDLSGKQIRLKFYQRNSSLYGYSQSG